MSDGELSLSWSPPAKFSFPFRELRGLPIHVASPMHLDAFPPQETLRAFSQFAFL